MEAWEEIHQIKQTMQDSQINQAKCLSLHFQQTHLPLLILKATCEGPVVWIQGALHGDEGYGTAACIELARELGGKLRAGCLIFCPVVNPTAFDSISNSSPIDGINLNRAGNSQKETFSFLFFAWLREIICSTADVFLDLHGGGSWLDVCSFAIIPAMDESLFIKSKNLLNGLVPYVLKTDGTRGTLCEAVAKEGKIAILLESGCGTVITRTTTDIHKRNIEGILARLGLLAADFSYRLWNQEITVFEKAVDLYFEKDAILLTYEKTGTNLRKGDRILHMADRNTFEEISLVSSVENTILLSVHVASCIKKGGYAAYLGCL